MESKMNREGRLPWERQPTETAKAFYAFTLYRDLGYKRSLAKVRQEYGKGRQRDVRRLIER